MQGYTPDKAGDLAMAGFVLKNTLSDNGAVTRGICQMNDAHYLTGVLETSGIEKTADGAAASRTACNPIRNIRRMAAGKLYKILKNFIILINLSLSQLTKEL